MKHSNTTLLFGILLTTMFTMSITSCKKEKTESGAALVKVFKLYKDGSIDVCKYKGQTVYCAARNAYDAGSKIYDKDGNPIGSCNYAWGKPDSICFQLTDCETIYRVSDNIWGQPGVDKIGLGE